MRMFRLARIVIAMFHPIRMARGQACERRRASPRASETASPNIPAQRREMANQSET